jgi:hypothetical protein
MKFKKTLTVVLLAFSTGFITPVFADAIPANPTEKASKEALTQQLTNRLVEIKNMDKSHLSSVEKKELRKEVKKIKRERKSNGVYLSVGAIIIIALLLILLL